MQIACHSDLSLSASRCNALTQSSVTSPARLWSLPEYGRPTWNTLNAYDSPFAPGKQAMLGELMNIPTDTLTATLFVIFASGGGFTSNDVAEVEQIQRELQRRADDRRETCRSTN